MRNGLMAALACVAASPALAGGVERSTQPMSILFEEGRYLEAEASFGSPSLTGNLAAGFGKQPDRKYRQKFFSPAPSVTRPISTTSCLMRSSLTNPSGPMSFILPGSALATLSWRDSKSKSLTRPSCATSFGGGMVLPMPVCLCLDKWCCIPCAKRLS